MSDPCHDPASGGGPVDADARRRQDAGAVPGPFGDQPLLTAMARRCLRAGPTRVVLGPGQAARRALLEGLDVDVLEAPEGAGMAASIVTGSRGSTRRSS
jgi:CTP:molybdopterin cytidylyltransferase MocA